MEQITKEELLDVIGKFELGDNTEVVSVEPYGCLLYTSDAADD